MSKNEEEYNSRERVRLRPVRRRIGLLLAGPLVALVGLWAFAATASLGAALDRIDYAKSVDDVGLPIGQVGIALQAERTAAATVLGSRGARGTEQLQAGQKGTDGALALFRSKALPAAREVVDETVQQMVRDLDRDYGRLGSLRARVASGDIAPVAAIGQYNALFDSANKTLSSLTSVDDAEIHQTIQALVNTYWARDFIMREDALLSASQSPDGRLPAAAHTAFTEAASNRRFVTDVALSGPSAVVRDAFQPVSGSPRFARYQELEQAIVNSRDRRISTASLSAWRATAPAVSQEWWQGTLAATAVLTDRTESTGRSVVYQLVLVGGLGLLVVIASIVLSLRFARDLSRELRGLQQAAQELARERLPRVVARLRRGEDVAVSEEAPPIRTGRTREIALVADAFTTVQRTAIETAVGEAQMRAGISRVFINLAWRSQSLLHRQLRMLDSMERRTSNPDELEDLFRLDHLTTRMRRHAEGLVILSGNENVRGWNEPVAIEHLLRAALAEVEDYARVDVMALSPARVSGSVVADVVHLLAELIENAASFSPPTTEVLVRAEEVGNGLAIEVVDRGIGLDAGDLAAINRRLDDPPEFDLADSDRLGLFVVARLADRHGIKVVLQRSAYGGVTAVVLLPTTLLVSGESPVTAREAENGALPRPVVHAENALGPGTVAGSGTASPALLLPGPQDRRMPVDGRHRAPDANSGPAPFRFPPAPPASPTPAWPSSPAPPPAVQVSVADEAPLGERAGEQGEEYDAETGGLPRRARQRNLAPQLRAAPGSRPRRPPPRPEPKAGGDGDSADRPPELSRDLLSSLQAGWTAGRDDDEDRTTVFEERMDRGDS